MRIIFICGSLEAGKDGVGDYTRHLGLELAKVGHGILICSFSDRAVREYCIETVAITGSSLTTVRCPSILCWQDREERLWRLIKEFKPDWISVQFVPFSFHSKGLCWRWMRLQNTLGRDYKLHVMFHEIWIAWCMPVKLTSRLLGVLQGAIFILTRPGRFISCATTSLPLYKTQLCKVGIVADRLPLFGNIPVTFITKLEARNWLLARLGLNANQQWHLAGFFGSLLPTFSVALFEAWLRNVTTTHVSVAILCAGRHDQVSADNWALITRLSAGKASAFNLGAMDVESVAHYLRALDVGLSAYPAVLLGKSGAAAAMIEHGLAVMALGKMRHVQGENPDQAIEFYAEGSGVKQVAAHFLKILK